MYVEQAPPAGLEEWIECAWSLEAQGPLRAYPVRPDGCIDILYSPGAGLEVAGTMTREQRFDIAAAEVRAGLRFRPGMARRLLRIPATELVDRTVALDRVDGIVPRELLSRLDDVQTIAVRRQLLIDAVGAMLRDEAPPDPVQRAIAAMSRCHGACDLDRLANQAGLSARQFRRRCVEETGLGPKHLSRVLRFRRACGLARRGETWPEVAARAGYFDQAHLIRDFREFTGQSPMSVFSKTAVASFG